MTRVLAVLALILLGAFFMPWFGPELGQVPGTNCGGGGNSDVSGFTLLRCVVTITFKAADVSEGFARTFDQAWFLWLLAAIPLFGLLTLTSGLAGQRSAVPYAFLAGAIPLGVVVYGFVAIDDASRYLAFLDVGAWITLGTCVLLVLLAFTPRT